MNSKKPGFDQAFIQKQRRQLIKLREELLRTVRTTENEEGSINSQSRGEANESEEDAQRLAMLETDGNVVAYDARRLARVERALAKIADGTYGLSDASGHAIPKERLEAMPDAIYTVEELNVGSEAKDPQST